MSEELAVEEQDVEVNPVGVWTIEINHPRNDDILLQSIPGQRLRSRIDGRRTVKDAKTGEEMIPQAQAEAISDFPGTPGMQLTVDPENLTYLITDPLYHNEPALDKLNRWVKRKSSVSADFRYQGLEAQEGKLDVHRMKTLCREMLQLIENGWAVRKKGAMPEIQDIDAMPGNYLLNPGSRVSNTQPQFEKDFDAWVANLAAQGG